MASKWFDVLDEGKKVMKLMKVASIVLGVCALASVSAYAQDVASGKSVNILPEQLKFQSFGAKGVDPKTEITAANAFGTFNQSAHGAFFKFSPGFVSPLHSHTADYFGVVIQGVGVNTQPGKAEVALPVGSYYFQKGGEVHVTKCLTETECVFFVNQTGKFDFMKAEK